MESWRKELYSSELCHHGILGQKWGVRRYQNPDGTMTELGKKRYITYNNENGEYKLTKKGRKKATEVVSEHLKRGGWTRSYNKTADKMNEMIPEINKKYEGKDFKKDKEAYSKYLREYDLIYKKTYKDAIREEYYGKLLVDFGKGFADDFMDLIPEMSPMYDSIAEVIKEEVG